VSLAQDHALDMSTVLLKAYEVGDLIKSSAEVADYLYWKERMQNHPETQRLLRIFARKKEAFGECERFGHYHPDYHAAKKAVEEVQAQLDELEPVRRFKEAENRLDDLLYTVSVTIAHSVSDTIKVPSNHPLPTRSGCGCGLGGGCSSCG